ncbi:EAL domain-containing protein [Xanthobacter sp. V3C-3]|uniref:EAL domain-containing protein n=1 Tax=Xanthobacter lutulentifluminis TaxID=3119935 RepID=UPI00372B050C
MKCPPVPLHEKDRLAALDSSCLAGQGPLADLTPLVEMALRIFNVPMAAVNMIGSDSVFFAAILQMGRALDMEVIAEGIESEAERACLAERDCPLGQGYLFGRPEPAREFELRLGGAALSAPPRKAGPGRGRRHH